jgi:hypothetical protein
MISFRHDAPVLCTAFGSSNTVAFSGGLDKRVRQYVLILSLQLASEKRKTLMIGGTLQLDNVEYWASMMIRYQQWSGVLISVSPLSILTQPCRGETLIFRRPDNGIMG